MRKGKSRIWPVIADKIIMNMSINVMADLQTDWGKMSREIVQLQYESMGVKPFTSHAYL